LRRKEFNVAPNKQDIGATPTEVKESFEELTSRFEVNTVAFPCDKRERVVFAQYQDERRVWETSIIVE
jgi:hypothetical protein